MTQAPLKLSAIECFPRLLKDVQFGWQIPSPDLRAVYFTGVMAGLSLADYPDRDIMMEMVLLRDIASILRNS